MVHDEWYTKKETYDMICKRHHVKPNLDVCASSISTKVEDNYITIDEDMFVTDWAEHKHNNTPKTIAFMNPPNTKLRLSINRALEMWRKHNITTLMLVPANVIARSYFEPIWELIESGDIEIGMDFKPLFKRPQFLERGVENKMGNRNDYIVIVLREYK